MKKMFVYRGPKNQTYGTADIAATYVVSQYPEYAPVGQRRFKTEQMNYNHNIHHYIKTTKDTVHRTVFPQLTHRAQPPENVK